MLICNENRDEIMVLAQFIQPVPRWSLETIEISSRKYGRFWKEGENGKSKKKKIKK